MYGYAYVHIISCMYLFGDSMIRAARVFNIKPSQEICGSFIEAYWAAVRHNGATALQDANFNK